MKASILAVGTELTIGQINNANAAWISKQLKSLGVLTSLHLTVPDDRDLIRMGLKLCADHSELIFVTGGLGPTSDDFTRDLITEWAGQALKFDETSWQKVVDRLTTRGFPVHDFQKQQCFFPETSQILDNSQGTANAFYLKSHSQPTNRILHLWALPGPPREIEAVWTDHIQGQIQKLTEKLDVHITRAWDLLGLGENQVAKIVEPLVAGSNLEVGYRVHLPYVEIKLSYFRSQTEMAKSYIQAVEQAVAPHCVSRDGQDMAQLFADLLNESPYFILEDHVTEGLVLKRLQPFLKALLKRQGFTYSQVQIAYDRKTDWKMTLQQIDEFSCRLELQKASGAVQTSVIEAPFKSPAMADRRKQYFAERALIEAVKLWAVNR